MSTPPPTSRLALHLRFSCGLGYLAIIAGFFSLATGIGFPLAFLAVVCGALFSCGLALAWATGWALRDDNRPRQFGISSLMFLTVYVALFFSVVRCLAMFGRNTPDELLAIVVACLVLTVASVPVLVLWTESLTWLAVWVVRRDCVQSWLARRRSRTDRRRE